MEEKSRYEEMYGKLVAYEQNIHLQNQKRIKIGLKCIAIIPPIFLILLFWTDSNKVVFLILMGKQLDEVEGNIKNAIQKLDEKFNSEAEIPKIAESDTKEKTE